MGLRKQLEQALLRIEQLEKENLELRKQNAELTHRLDTYENPNIPSSRIRFKENTKKEESNEDKPRFPGRPEGHDGDGIRMPRPDRIIEHKITQKSFVCIGKRTQTIIDIVEKPIIVTKHIIYEYRTPNGDTIEAPNNLSSSTYGPNLQAFLTLMRGISGASHKKLSRIITSLRPDLSLCPSTVQTLTDSIAQKLAKPRKKLLHNLRKSPYNNADETGLRQDGTNGYVWTFCTPTSALYEFDLSRGHDVPERILGIDYKGFVVCDGWQAYDAYNRQRCWVHLDRELDFLAEKNTELTLQTQHFKDIYERAKKSKKLPLYKRLKIIQKLDSPAELGHIIEVLKTTHGAKKFATKLTNARPFLFTGVEHPDIPLDNNHGERTIRPIVTHRKSMGCIRNEKGKRFIENTMSMMQTWHMQGKDIYSNLKRYAG